MGFFEDFRGSDSVLVSGQREGLTQLAETLRALNEPDERATALHELPFIAVHGRLRLTAFPRSSREQLECVDRTAQHVEFQWRMQPDGWLEIAEKIEAVAERQCGHAYISTNSGADDAAVVISKGEYSDEWWAQHAPPPIGK